MNTVLIVQLEDLDDNPPEFEFEEKTRDPRSGYAYAKCLFHQIIVYVYEYNTIIYSQTVSYLCSELIGSMDPNMKKIASGVKMNEKR